MPSAVHAHIVKAAALELGFDRVGITRAEPSARATYYREWLAHGHAGTMAYLSRNINERLDPRTQLAGARSVVCVALNYRRDSRSDAAGTARPDAREPTGRVAQYARGRDYHVVVRERLRALAELMRRRLPVAFEACEFVDTGPLLERELAARAGLGWIGKNTCLLHHELGSFAFLGELVTTLDLEPDAPLPDHCGSCTRCLDACPTQAFPAPYQLDASRCISYLTIEHLGEIAPELRPGIGDWVFGCDVCQDVCPFNARAPFATDPQLCEPRIPARVPLRPLVNLRSGDHRRLIRGTAARRATRATWQRNARIAWKNQEGREAPPG
ncbi:MAG: tRNA epoxyqueuosine(34) reductase QueG [Phycisphaerae bacterium]